MKASSAPILYSFRRCPYAMRARMALAVSTVACVIREVSLRDKPAVLLAASPKGTVPVLVLQDGCVIDESLDIMHWALGQNDPQQWLAADETMMDTMMSVIASNDGPFKFHLDRMKYANRYPGSQPAEHRAEAVKLLAPLETRLCNHTYLFGSAPMLADIAIFPFVRQFAHADAAAFAALPLPGLQAWLAGWESSALFQSVMAKYPVWQPDHEDICLK
ncbi:MAG: glutathione S-transferase [Steroidobacteraceae bacterium]